MTGSDAELILRRFDIVAEPLDDGRWWIMLPWALGTPLASGELVPVDEVIEFAEALVDAYTHPERRARMQQEIQTFLAELT